MQMFLGQKDPVQSWPVQNGQCKVETNHLYVPKISIHKLLNSMLLSSKKGGEAPFQLVSTGMACKQTSKVHTQNFLGKGKKGRTFCAEAAASFAALFA